MARAFGMYDATLMSLIHRFKYEGKIQLARPLGRLLFEAFIQFWKQDAIDLIIPVPLFKKRFRKRGFNQAYLLVQSWKQFAAVQTDFKMPRMVTDVLIRHHQTKPQTGLGRKERMTNLKNAFSVSDASIVWGKKILLTDDVYTTGATAHECAGVLLNAGASRVDVLTLARA
jgi:ComF family protein